MIALSQPTLQVKEILSQEIPVFFCGIELKILRVSLIHNNHHPWVIPFHTHPTMELHYILSGRGQIQICDTTFPVQAGDVYVTLPFVPHQQISSAEEIMEEYCLECTMSFSDPPEDCCESVLSLRNFVSRQVFSSCRAPNALLPMLQQLEVECCRPYSGQSLQVRQLGLGCVLQALEPLSSERSSAAAAHRETQQNYMAIKIKSYLDMNFRDPISLEEIARQFYLSTKQLNRIFQNQYQQTITAYLKNLRFHCACQLMEDHTMSLRNIALQSGFTGYQQLHRMLQQSKDDH